MGIDSTHPGYKSPAKNLEKFPLISPQIRQELVVPENASARVRSFPSELVVAETVGMEDAVERRVTSWKPRVWGGIYPWDLPNQ